MTTENTTTTEETDMTNNFYNSIEIPLDKFYHVPMTTKISDLVQKYWTNLTNKWMLYKDERAKRKNEKALEKQREKEKKNSCLIYLRTYSEEAREKFRNNYLIPFNQPYNGLGSIEYENYINRREIVTGYIPKQHLESENLHS